MLPAPAQFEAAAGGLGICDLDRVVVYDDQGLFSAARVWWTFKAMGHREIAVLDGGLPAWIDAGGAVTHEATAVAAAAYRAKPEPSLVASHAQVRRALAERSSLVLDARPSGRFLGRDREPRPGLKSGAMPGAASLPYSALITADGRLKSAPELAALFAAAGADGSEAIIATCGSGVSAAILSLALEALGRTPARLYDGAWAEWGRIANDPARFPVTTGDR